MEWVQLGVQVDLGWAWGREGREVEVDVEISGDKMMWPQEREWRGKRGRSQ